MLDRRSRVVDTAKGGFPSRMGAAGAGTTRRATKLDEGANAATAANWHDNPDSQTRGMLGVVVKLTHESWAMEKADVYVLRFWALPMRSSCRSCRLRAISLSCCGWRTGSTGACGGPAGPDHGVSESDSRGAGVADDGEGGVGSGGGYALGSYSGLRSEHREGRKRHVPESPECEDRPQEAPNPPSSNKDWRGSRQGKGAKGACQERVHNERQ